MAGDGWQQLTIDDLKADTDGAIAIGPFGSRMKSDCYVPSGVPVIRGNNISSTREFGGEFVYITEEKANELRSSNVFPDDLVFPHRGAIGEVGIVPRSGVGRYVLSSSLMKLSCNKSLVDPMFLFHFFRSEPGRHELLKNASTVGTPGIGQPLTSLRLIRVPVPPLAEQRAIADILGVLDDKIELNRQMNETLEGLARTTFKSWFVDFDPVRAKRNGIPPSTLSPATTAFFPDSFYNSQIGMIPVGWRVGRIVDCCEKTGNGGTPKRDIRDYWERGTVPWLTSGEVRQSIVISTENFISERGLRNSSAKMWPVWTTVVALYGATAGQTCVIATKLCGNQACCGLIAKPHHRFFNYLLLSSSVAQLEQLARGSAQQNLSKQIVEELPSVLAPDAVLKAFEELMSPIFDQWVANLRESRTLAAIRDALLPKLLSGEIRAAEAERLAAEVT